ncbi:DUF4249 domain-containing protein [Flavobacterium luminosum]|uniref:DUF4249 domain-containing protein n=1 Tax=Flavobacterium luminosum TaxID=2949086 RepID=A0ABT0TKZ3_9FLAO|nr:DUF4249 domain-containing protein [Flavobacterium sp. HXWNR70]MCL9807976.1 DUF4249 domain-containing protein [Flavobacterium sp. HXWNR70]
MKKTIIQFSLFLLISLFIISCTEPMALQTDTFEEVIVIEATITNELKRHEIKISKTYKFEDAGPTYVTDATVFIKDDLGNMYNFVQDAGKYVSVNPFKAVTGRTYQLRVIAENKEYSSTLEKLTTENTIEDIVPTVTTKEGVKGLELFVKSYDPTNTSKYYRYEYEETYRVEAPNWVYKKAIVTGPTSIDFVFRDSEARVCYSTEKSTDIIVTNTNEQSEDRVNFPIRFISDQNPIIAHRYSILVKQYVQNLEAHTFYKTLKEISGSEGILSQNQPGFLYGNLKCETDPDEKVIGFFDISSVSEKRIFFNFTDYFPDQPFPPYFYKCEPFNMIFCFGPSPECVGEDIIYYLNNNQIVYYYGNKPDLYFLDTPCGDCTSFSSNIRPSFWID